MAMQKDIIKTTAGFSGQLVAKNVYLKVASVNGGKDSMRAMVTGVCDGMVVFNESYSFTPNLSGDNFIAQAYKHLKTLPDFTDAQDI
jgi:hypothetical protein